MPNFERMELSEAELFIEKAGNQFGDKLKLWLSQFYGGAITPEFVETKVKEELGGLLTTLNSIEHSN